MYGPYQKKLDEVFRELGWQYWEPLKITTRLSEELGEVAREIGHHYGGKKKKADEPEGDMEEEMGDMLYTLICFANSNGYDFDRAVQRSLVESIVYQSFNPLSILANLTNRVGIFTGAVDYHYRDNGVEYRDVVPAIEVTIGNILRVLTLLADQTGCTIDKAFHKSVNKVLVRDKDRFPDGV
jgi:NTP pyrophosphatase (non-canonical NTP hydrolase)